ncbi:MAG: hypothetical protein ACYCWN_11405 [Ferrimicrobium sp.]|jgi:hypothetical protein|uniref:Uncharacterized protein n=1 Tax=Ferrimicrobium acidiphilum TaxID=121039 RepID=A0ABV3Y4G7_9ACTN|nr:hypothetical protein [Ferrimicrobium sp.]
MSDANELRSLASTYRELAARVEKIERRLLADKIESPAQPLRQVGAHSRAILRELDDAVRRLESHGGAT